MYESAIRVDVVAAGRWAPRGERLASSALPCGLATLRSGPGLLASPILAARSPYAAVSLGPALGNRASPRDSGPGFAASPTLSPRCA
jgi:hypothetical protein